MAWWRLSEVSCNSFLFFGLISDFICCSRNNRCSVFRSRLILLLILTALSSGLTFDIYEGQITALLGHSGAGKSSLLNVLCGICQPNNGTATIYGFPAAEIAGDVEMKHLVGVCPQFNIVFDVLTVEEHLRMFAAIKGIPSADTDAEVVPSSEKSHSFGQAEINLASFIG